MLLTFVCLDVENTWSCSLTKLHLMDPLSLPQKAASDTQPGSILAPLPPVDFVAGFKESKTQPRAPSTSIGNQFALHPAPHLLGIKEERHLKLWAGGTSWGCLWGAGRSGHSTPGRQPGSVAQQAGSGTVPCQLCVLQYNTNPLLPGIYSPAWCPGASSVCRKHLCPGLWQHSHYSGKESPYSAHGFNAREPAFHATKLL